MSFAKPLFPICLLLVIAVAAANSPVSLAQGDRGKQRGPDAKRGAGNGPQLVQMLKQLNLSPEQGAAIQQIMLQYQQQFFQMRGAAAGGDGKRGKKKRFRVQGQGNRKGGQAGPMNDQMRAAVQQLRGQMMQAIGQVLTEDQKQQLKQMIAQNRGADGAKGGGKKGGGKKGGGKKVGDDF